MFEYLCPSPPRRRLLHLLLREQAHGTVSQLAREGQLAYGTAHRELELMAAAGLAEVRREGGRVLYAAARDPRTKQLARWLGSSAAVQATSSEPSAEDQDVRAWLRDLGAPLLDAGRPKRSARSKEHVLAAAVALSHRDPTVARVLPWCFAHLCAQLDFARLEHEARHIGQRHALGLFLALAAELGRQPSLAEHAERLRDRRVRRVRDFFPAASRGYARQLADARTPELVRSFGYRMNMTLADFAAVFDKHDA